MITSLTNLRVLVGITGGIAAYKSPDLIRRLRECGAIVKVVMTESATAFITSLTIQAVTGDRPYNDLLSVDNEAAMSHIELAKWAEVIVVAPASADFIARIAHGLANDLLTTLCLATTAPIIVAPAMNRQMWSHVATQANITLIQKQGVQLFGPESGSQACGDVGQGRMMEPLDIVAALQQHLHACGSRALQGYKIMITAGPTREALDPFRYLSNASSGKMGYALAEVAVQMGAEVTLVSGPSACPVPDGVDCIKVISACEMFDAVMENIEAVDVLIAAAAVADYRPQVQQTQKIKKQDQTLTINLLRNPDILAEVASLPSPPLLIGFAAESECLLQYAREKLQRKKLAMIVANQIGEGLGFEADDNQVTCIDYLGGEETLPKMSKINSAKEILIKIKKLMSG